MDSEVISVIWKVQSLTIWILEMLAHLKMSSKICDLFLWGIFTHLHSDKFKRCCCFQMSLRLCLRTLIYQLKINVRVRFERIQSWKFELDDPQQAFWWIGCFICFSWLILDHKVSFFLPLLVHSGQESFITVLHCVKWAQCDFDFPFYFDFDFFYFDFHLFLSRQESFISVWHCVKWAHQHNVLLHNIVGATR